MFNPRRPIRHLKRYTEIVSVFARHGFGFLMPGAGSRAWSQWSQRVAQPDAQQQTGHLAIRFRQALEELGPTFIKFGQILSTRPDLLPLPFITELSKLVDSVSPEPWETIHAQLTRELGQPPEAVFAFIDPQPIASASLSQVHAGVLPGGEQVIIKVQRPNISQVIQTDLEILASLAASLQSTSLGELYDFVATAEDFAFTLRNELDYTREGRSADRLRENFAGEKRLLYIPKVYWQYTTPQVLVMERIDGIKITDIAALDAAGYDRHKIGLNSVNVTIKMIMEDGFFHADPHAGNYLILPGEVIGLVDFGKVGYLRDKDRMDLVRLYIVSVELDVDGMIDQLSRMGAVRDNVDRNRLAYDLNRFMNKYYGVPIKYVRARELLDEFTTITFRHRLRLPSAWWLVAQTIAMLEGIGLQLDPDFDVFSAAAPHINRLMRNLIFSQTNQMRSLVLDAANWGDMLHRLPRVGSRMLERLERNEPISMEIRDVDRILSRLDHLATRVALSLLVAAFVVGLPLLLQLAVPGSLPGWLILALIIPIIGAGIWLGLSLLGIGKK